MVCSARCVRRRFPLYGIAQRYCVQIHESIGADIEKASRGDDISALFRFEPQLPRGKKIGGQYGEKDKRKKKEV